MSPWETIKLAVATLRDLWIVLGIVITVYVIAFFVFGGLQ